jgi:hypothetical protein
MDGDMGELGLGGDIKGKNARWSEWNEKLMWIGADGIKWNVGEGTL